MANSPAASKKSVALTLSAKGQTRAQIARTLGVTERTVYNWLSTRDSAEVKKYNELTPATQASIQWSADAFKVFFDRYSGLVLSPLHLKWVEQAMNHENLLINVPPRHAKSKIFSVWFPIWLIAGAEAVRLGRTGDEFGLRDVQIIIVSQTSDLAKKFTREIEEHLANNELLSQDFGPFKPPSDSNWPWRPNSGELLVYGRRRKFLPGDLSIQVRGSGQQILGMEANWVIVDDPASRKNQETDGERTRISEWFHGEVMSRLEPESRCIVIGQRVALNDLYGEIANEGTEDDRVWHHINYPAILDWDSQETLWPEKWDWTRIMKQYRRVGAAMFEVMYQQNPMPESRRLARKEWLYGDETHPGCVDLDETQGYRLLEPGWVRVVSLDPSPTRRAGLVVADVYRPTWEANEFNIRILEIVHEPMTVHQMIDHLSRVQKMYNPSYFIFEAVAAQRWFLQDDDMEKFKRTMRVIPHMTTRNKGDMNLGLESLAVDFEMGRMKFPYADPDSKAMTEMLFDEARAYPEVQYDDLLMALWFIKWNFRQLMPVLSFQEKPAGGYYIPSRLSNGYGEKGNNFYGY